MSKELFEALNVLEKENNISKEVLFEAIENSLLTACKNHFGRADNIKVYIDREKCDFAVYAEKEVVEAVEDPLTQVSLAEAKLLDPRHVYGDVIRVNINSKEFGRIATQNAKKRNSPEDPRGGAHGSVRSVVLQGKGRSNGNCSALCGS